MNAVIDLYADHPDFVEVDPTGRYGRYNEILGKGASKTVYRAFDEYEGIEVAWNQVKLNDFLQSPDDLERLYCEIHLLKTLKHKNIMKFCASWVDTANRNINFVTEMFTSGTLRQYRMKHKRVNIRAIKNWCRQILKGLLYLHSHDPPVIHRDLKCDNIFVNGNQGEVKIGDLGLAAFLRKSHAARCVGTPEFMAPEVYAEEYNELVDIYAFGMCILEMVTFEYPYSECTHPAQIYKKVISGKKPNALYKVKDPEVRRFVEKCLATVSDRLSARELLHDPFLQSDDYLTDLGPVDDYRDFNDVGPMLQEPLLSFSQKSSSLIDSYTIYFDQEHRNGLEYHQNGYETNGIDLLNSQEESLGSVDITINGKRREDDGIFLRLRIADEEGRVRNIYFPFDIETDTALCVAAEMIAELDLTDQDMSKIAEMIDGEIACLVPEWKRRLYNEEIPNYSNGRCCQNCASNGSLLSYLTLNGSGAKNLQVLCPQHGCGSIHGRFEEITYQFEGSEQCLTESAPLVSSQSDIIHYTDIWAQHEGPELRSQNSSRNQCDDHLEPSQQSTFSSDEKIIKIIEEDRYNAPETRDCPTSPGHSEAADYENEIRQELRWLKAKYQMQLRELGVVSTGIVTKPSSLLDSIQSKKDLLSSVLSTPREVQDGSLHQSLISDKHFPPYLPVYTGKKCANQMLRDQELAYSSCSPEHMITAKSYYTGALLPHPLHRATSLPVDAIDV
ncbi:probable serine/threonine-protein kinase WNK9 isoform X1 [Coffea eugenioides]|uniref:non-specific serine/threonine protein kinase n=1 Tax=Coffea arabica TaxID=13443 RepID=A0A6P6X149_COFAR|nr:probable serine/threonine-protein kinase WNK9 [Coffea arabica]XP_027116281.1 probable serine/threonine-protein kinase WNK9 [Coffea arabica]XP_027121298.1 probable serine/threonine-protein kinase WNK9 [Coffea arabica]XP_027121299.1 probable serine/threonine-protein kinase WNK9 [Coffea arabica]XP_027164886.1 probable serine/threonine-protein kinase WNK9 isoform X1 [Coffea eugenioides]XP_027164887.1 probable serine/threonine-protein kinase WNK9 isoform X1 [Coffea eugenioides]